MAVVVGVGLAESIEALRAGLMSAVEKGQSASMLFQLEPVELTLQVEVTKDINGKVGWQVLEAGASRETVTTQTLKLVLRPLWRQSDGTVTADFLVADQQLSGQHFGPKPSA